MISIVMAYYKRQAQLLNTLKSIEKSECKDFNLIIVDDASGDDLNLPETKFPIDIIRIYEEEKIWANPEPAYNMGIQLALLKYSPDVIILQNPECIHVGDVLSYAEKNVSDSNYIPFRCIALDKESTFGEDVDIVSIANNCTWGASKEGEIAWYNHPKYRNCHLDYCSAISVKNMIRLNGYDERFMIGMAYSDNYLVHRIKLLDLEIHEPEYPFVAHQWHYEDWYWKKRNGHLYGRNCELLKELVKTNDIKAEHLITPDFESVADKSLGE
jgi:glycosyltransferase involved in cell wall biosynthesis